MKSVFGALVASLLFSVPAFSAVQSANCESTMGTGRQVQLYFMADTLKQVRVINGTRTVPLIPVALQTQSSPNKTVYSIIGSSELIEMDNTIPVDGIGFLRIAGEHFSCF